jgi:hypothetical protein
MQLDITIKELGRHAQQMIDDAQEPIAEFQKRQELAIQRLYEHSPTASWSSSRTASDGRSIRSRRIRTKISSSNSRTRPRK